MILEFELKMMIYQKSLIDFLNEINQEILKDLG
jgi:hypothetical protein